MLGSTSKDSQSKCKGQISKVPVDSFKQVLRNLVNTDNLNHLKPVGPEEVKEFNKNRTSDENLAEIQTELDKIDFFILAYGKNNAPLTRREQLERDLLISKKRFNAIKKINHEIEKVINTIIEEKLTVVDSNLLDSDDETKKAKTQFMYTVLKKFDPLNKGICGNLGTIEERIQECSTLEGSVKGNFVLVTRTKDFKEIYKDIKSGLIWGDTLPRSMSHLEAQSVCANKLAEVSGIKTTWRLPTKEEFEEAEKNRVRESLPNIDHFFWSSSARSLFSSLVWRFNGLDGYTDIYFYRNDNDSVRCVAR